MKFQFVYPNRSLNSLQDKISYLIQSIKTYTNRHGRTLASVFLTLPSKTRLSRLL